MSQSPIYWFFVVVLGLLCIWYYLYTRHETAQHIVKGKIQVAQSEAMALQQLLAASGVPAHKVRVIRTASEDPCWYAGWPMLDRYLYIDRRFGRFGENCVGVDGDQIVSLSLVHHQLESTDVLDGLENLQSIQLRQGRIKQFPVVKNMSMWRHLNLQSNALEDMSALEQCASLEILDISFNSIKGLAGFEGMPNLERLSADNNNLVSVTGLQGHPSLREVALTNNKLDSLSVISRIRSLELLHFSGNTISSLEGLTDLPVLRSIHLGTNPITSISTSALEGMPLLRHVALYQTGIFELPEGFTFNSTSSWKAELVSADGRQIRVDISGTPLAESLAKVQEAEHESMLAAGEVVQVESLPEGRGRVQGASKRGSSGGLLSQSVNYQGEIDWLDGTYNVGFDMINRSIGVTVTATVQKGKLRVYLKNSQGGFYYKQASPNAPLEISGYLLTGTSTYFVYFESVGGRAEGISWTIR